MSHGDCRDGSHHGRGHALVVDDPLTDFARDVDEEIVDAGRTARKKFL